MSSSPSSVGITRSILLTTTTTLLFLASSSFSCCDAYHVISTAPRIASSSSSHGSTTTRVASSPLLLKQKYKTNHLFLHSTPFSLSFSRSSSIHFMSSSSSSSEEEDDEEEKEKDLETEPSNSVVEVEEEEASSTTSFWSKINIFKQQKDADGLTTRQRLAKMGMTVLLSYGFVSNMSYSVMVSLAWYGFSKKTGQSPLAPDQWKAFLAVYAGFYVFNNIIRPLRLGVSVAVSKYFDSAVAYIQRKTNLSKSLSIGIVVFFANVVGTLGAMCLGISIASKLAGVPIFPPKVVPVA